MKNFSLLTCVWLFVCITPSGVNYAQSVDEIFNKFTKRYHTYQGVTLPYYLFVPAAYDSQASYPLVLCLHGSGEVGDNPSAVKTNSMAVVWARDSNQTRWPCIILVPQCPAGGWWTNSNILLTVNNILDSLLVEFSIHKNRLYITGLSMGGYGTWEFIARFPDKFAAAVPMSGGGDPSKALLIKHIPLWNFHGALDGSVPVTESRLMMTALENAGVTVVYTNCHQGNCTGLSDSVIADTLKKGAKHIYTEYENGGHAIWDQSYNNIYLLPWVFSQTTADRPTSTGEEYVYLFPKEPYLSQNYPNPFNPTTTIEYQIPNVGTQNFVSLRVYDVLGREVVVIFSGILPAGSYTKQWNANGMPSGIYFYRLSVVPARRDLDPIDGRTGKGYPDSVGAGSYTETKKLVLLK